jgi:hypothetical protein
MLSLDSHLRILGEGLNSQKTPQESPAMASATSPAASAEFLVGQFVADTAAAPGEYITGADAKRILGTGWYTLLHAALVGDVRADVCRGRHTRFCREDIERLAAARRETATAAR